MPKRSFAKLSKGVQEGRMKIEVRTKNAMLLGNGLVAHIVKVQTYMKKHGRLPNAPLLTYTQLVELSGAKLAMIGIGNPLDEVMQAVHAPNAPKNMRGLTMFVRPKSGEIAYGAGRHDWHGINATNVKQYRKDVLDYNWEGVEFVATDV
jgi:hypothetical protein